MEKSTAKAVLLLGQQFANLESIVYLKANRDCDSNIIQIDLKENVTEQKTVIITMIFKVLAEIKSEKTTDVGMEAVLW